MAEQNSYDFWTRYSNLCLKCKVCPLKCVIKHMRGTKLCCPVERIRSEHWQFLLSALSIDNSLTQVCFTSDLPCLDIQKEFWKKGRRRINDSYPIPYGYSPSNIGDICKYTARLLTVSQALQVLIIENLPITKEDAEDLAEGLRDSGIREFAFRGHTFSDDVIEIICRGLWDSRVCLIDFSACNLSFVGLKYVCNVIKKHKNRVDNEVFPEYLRCRIPIFENLVGLSRVTLNGNYISDEGVAILCESITDDLCIKALDLQCCGISNEGALTILKEITTNNGIRVADLRLNNIDEAILNRISIQLCTNGFGKIVTITQQPLFQPRFFVKTIRTRPIKLKTKAKKKYSRPLIEQKSMGKCRKISCNIFEPKDPITKDAVVQTFASNEVVQLQERVRRLEFRLLKEMSFRDSLMDLMEKFKLENVNLRKEVIKLSTFEDVILIDQETYSEIKHVFEKFQRFLRLMKDNGLWGLVSTIGVAEYENTKLKAVPSDSKVCMVEKEPPIPATRPPNGPVKVPTVPKPQTRCCSCRKPECISNQKAEKENHGSNVNHAQKGNQDRTHIKNIVDKAKVTKVFKELRETYSNCDFTKNQLPPVPPSARKLSGGELPTGQKPVPGSKPCGHNPPNAEIPNKFKQLKTRQDLYEAVKNEMERIECVCQLHKVPLSPERAPPAKNQGNVNNKGYFKNVSSQTATVESIVNYIAHKPNRTGPSSAPVSHKCSFSPSSSTTRFPPECYPCSPFHTAVKIKSQEWDEHVKKNFPQCNEELHKAHQARLDSPSFRIIGDPDYFKTNSTSKKRTSSGSEQTHGTSKISASEKPLQNTNSGSTKPAPNPNSLGRKEADSVSGTSCANSIESLTSEKGIKSQLSRLSSEKDNSSKSYLESVSDASTDKDVKSFSEIEIYDSVSHSNSIPSKSASKSSKVPKAAGGTGSGATSADSSSKSSKKNQKQKKPVNQNSTKLKGKNASSSSVPSLSDITTVSSHSLNTESVMGQLSGSEKGLS